MGFFDRIFGTSTITPEPNIHFGRYTDAYKSSQQYDSWDLAEELFEEGKYIQAYEAFLTYLSDNSVQNVNFHKKEDRLNFEIFQGSKKIIGTATKDQVIVEAKIAKAQSLESDFMERLIRRNFDLKYARFALDDQEQLTIKFDSSTIDGSPYKLYAALKELATNADKQDDLLQDEFDNLTLIGNDHLRPIPDKEKKIKYDFIVQSLQAVVDTISDHGKPVEEYPGAIGYHLLNTTYKLDYLIRPEGFMMEALERIHRLYFAKDDRSMADKVKTVRAEFQALLNRPAEDFYKEMYLVTSTFGITNPVGHDRVRAFINGELGNRNWYRENEYLDTALAVPGYIVGYCLFNFAIPLPDRAYFHLYYQIMESEYFQALGFTNIYFDHKKNKFKRKEIQKAIRQIAKNNNGRFPNLNPNTNILDYSSPTDFAKSYLLMVRDLDLTGRR